MTTQPNHDRIFADMPREGVLYEAQITTALHRIAAILDEQHAAAPKTDSCRHGYLRCETCTFGPCGHKHDGVSECQLPMEDCHIADEQRAARQVPVAVVGAEDVSVAADESSRVCAACGRALNTNSQRYWRNVDGASCCVGVCCVGLNDEDMIRAFRSTPVAEPPAQPLRPFGGLCACQHASDHSLPHEPHCAGYKQPAQPAAVEAPYVPTENERVRVIEVAPWDNSAEMRIGEEFTASSSCFTGKDERFLGWVLVSAKLQAGTWCRVEPVAEAAEPAVPVAGETDGESHAPHHDRGLLDIWGRYAEELEASHGEHDPLLEALNEAHNQALHFATAHWEPKLNAALAQVEALNERIDGLVPTVHEYEEGLRSTIAERDELLIRVETLGAWRTTVLAKLGFSGPPCPIEPVESEIASLRAAKEQVEALTKERDELKAQWAKHEEICSGWEEDPPNEVDRLNPYKRGWIVNESNRPTEPRALFLFGIRYYAGMLEDDDDNPSHSLGHIEECCVNFDKFLHERAGKVYVSPRVALTAEKERAERLEAAARLALAWFDQDGSVGMSEDAMAPLRGVVFGAPPSVTTGELVTSTLAAPTDEENEA